MILLHGFGARYDLPISLALYLYGAAGVVVISFVMVAVFSGDRVGARALGYPTRPVGWLTGLVGARPPLLVTRTIGVLALAAIVGYGWFGSPEPTRNPAEYLLWIYFWAGLVILTGLLGPLWRALDPFTAIDAAIRRAWPGDPARERARAARLAWLGIWPAAAFYLGFACLELTTGLAGRPAVVAGTVALYTALTVVGMRLLGQPAWSAQFEFANVLLGLVARFAPIRVAEGRVELRPLGAGLLDPIPAGWDRVLFVVLMLSTLAFDGLISTPLWQELVAALEPVWGALGQWGFFAMRTFGLVDLTLIFLVLFLAVMRLVIMLASVRVDALATTTEFALTLVPIALVYNAAHNYSYLVVQSQGLVAIAVPGFQPSFLLAGAAIVWYVQLVLIVVGHVMAVYSAHLRAGASFRTPRNALLSQYPMLLLMVAYTMTSLWILAQPVTRGG